MAHNKKPRGRRGRQRSYRNDLPFRDGADDSAFMFRAAFRDMLEDRRCERRAKFGRAALYFLMIALPLGIYVWFYAHASGFRLGPSDEVVGVVRIEGQIAPGALASADKIIPALKKAFESPRVKAVVLSIDSPGGSPVESERIYRMIHLYKASNPKPVIAVINNIGASAAYLIALHCDKIVAGHYSLIGSIGAVLAGWDVHQALDRLDVSQRVYASGHLKSMLSPFLPMSSEANRKAQDLVDQAGGQFTDELFTLRSAKLKDGIDYGSGEVWAGAQALSIGVIDEIGTIDELVRKTWGLPSYDYGPRRGSLGLTAQATEWIREAVLGRTSEPLALR